MSADSGGVFGGLVGGRKVTGSMGIYPAILGASALLSAVCAGFILAQSPRQRVTQLVALLVGGAAWWALCGALWNAAPDADSAYLWMRLSVPGWAFLGALLPHIGARYLDIYPASHIQARRRVMLSAAVFGYAAGIAEVVLAWMGWGVHGEITRTPWGWDHGVGPAQLGFFVASSVPLTVALVGLSTALRSPVAVAQPVHRTAIRAGFFIPFVLVGATDVWLPLLGIPFPRLGSTSYALSALVTLASALRFGFSFVMPRHFSEEILETLNEGVALITLERVIRRANRALVSLTGLPPEAIVGSELASLLTWEAPEDLAAVEEAPGNLVCADGSKRPVAVSAAPLLDDAGNAVGVVVVMRDLREVNALRRSMVTQARLAAVGELAAGVAHEINNPLAFVRANLSQLALRWKSLCDAPNSCAEERNEIAEEGRDLIGESQQGVDRAAEIVRGLCRFTQAGRAITARADLNELVEDTLTMLGPQLREAGVRVEFQPGCSLPILCAPQELRQVFLNLVVNAIDALDAGGRIAVATLQEEGEVVVEVADSGPGIPSELLERIFDPFFTTKDEGEGSGLGLGIAWSIVEAHGGRIEVEAPPGGGSVFRVRLPLEENVAR